MNDFDDDELHSIEGGDGLTWWCSPFDPPYPFPWNPDKPWMVLDVYCPPISVD